MPEKQRWHHLISCVERQAPSALEKMIEDASVRLVASMPTLRQCQHQREANKLYELVIGQSNRRHFLAQFANDESKRLLWLIVDQRRSTHH